MGSFFRRSVPAAPDKVVADGIPIAQIDTAKQYDVYCAVSGEERLYENVRFVSIRTFERITEFSSYVSGFLEIELPDRTRLLIPNFGIQLICEHGIQPAFRVVRQWGNW